MAKCTVLPPTALPLLLEPSCSGFSPPEMRSSVQYSLVCSDSSEANSSSGRNHGPASRPTTENPCSASRQASVPPPAPVPTIRKSTGSDREYCRIGIQAPGRITSGARPALPRGGAGGPPAKAVLPPGVGPLPAPPPPFPPAQAPVTP